jgi:uncharacterized protein
MGDSDRDNLTVRTVARITDLEAADWDACAGAGNPFVSHAFLKTLEDSNSAVRETGWMPSHVAVEDAEGKLLACAPAYIKSHSQGEYVFDYGWAQAFERAGGHYYPKLLVAVPFSPVPGPRLLAGDSHNSPQLKRVLALALAQIATQADLSSVHINFASEDEWRLMGDLGYLQRTGVQFHWENDGYATFDDFLANLSSRKRKAIRKERREAMENDIEFHVLRGDRITTEHWDAFFGFYIDTGNRKWGQPYLTRAFFDLLGERLGERVALFMCRRQGRWIAGALNLVGTDTLYGRYWGCIEDHRFLHFETCYYRAIDFAIEHGLKRVEAGAQGEHKIQRGYLPVRTYSAHWITHEGLRDAVARFLEEETRHIDWEVEAINREYSPFRKDDGCG